MEKTRQPIRFALLFIIAAFVTPGRSQTITLKTSDTLADLGQKWAETYRAKHAQARIEVTAGTTASAFAALAERKINIAMVPRGIRYKEAQPCEAAFGSRPTEFKVGVNGLAVYVHADNPVKVLTYDELDDIFRGKQINWKAMGGNDALIAAYGMSTNTAVGELFVEEVLAGNAIGKNTKIVPESELLKAVARDPNAIGFGPLTQAEGVRALKIKRAFSSTPMEPAEDTISKRIYPISRWLYCYIDPAANKDEIKAYLDWIRGDEGQQVAQRAGFYLLPAKWRTTP